MSDRNPNKKRLAVKEIEKIVKTMMENNSEKRIVLIIDKFVRDFVNSGNPSLKKGGLTGLAAVTIGIH